MPTLILNDKNSLSLRQLLDSDVLIVVCLCAAWCDVCRDYRIVFDALAVRHPDCHFVWIDIEDQANLLGDFEVENFPTLLIQRGTEVGFFGSVPPGLVLADRLVQSQRDKSVVELIEETSASAERQRWRDTIHLRHRLADHDGAA